MLILNFLYLDLIRYMLFICCFVSVWVFVALGWQFCNPWALVVLEDENNTVEFTWTIVPTFMVMFLCFFNLRCLGPDILTPSKYIVKVIGRQWYWSYDVSYDSGSYDSLMMDFLNSVDKPLRLFASIPYTFLVTSSDVIHSFSLPSFNLKIDAVPGRINQVNFLSNRVGVFVGYCSELCGAGHAYMPIVVEVVGNALV